MKKLAAIIIVVLFVASTIVSCGPAKPPCPAYGQTDVEHTDNNA